MHPFLQNVQNTIARHCLLAEGEPVVVALSGGADSVALLLALAELGYDVVAAHCNFQLRGKASDDDEEFVRALCQRYQIVLHIRHFDTLNFAQTQGVSIEMAARTLRYDWFATLGGTIAVGHHLEDNAETLLLNLCRGTGIAGLAAMRHRNGNVIRPLLDCTRESLEDYLRAKGETFRTDHTNADTRFRRNKVRHEILPQLATLNPDIIATLHATALRFREAEQIYRVGVESLRKRMVQTLSDGFCIDWQLLHESPAPATLLHEWLSPLGFDAPQQLLTAPVGTLLEGTEHLATRTATTIEVRQYPQPDCSLDSLHMEKRGRKELDAIPRASNIACLDADKIKGQLYLRQPQRGDRFQPFGLRGSKLVSDFLTDRHLSRIDKLNVRLLCDDEGIVWIVGHRIAQRVAVTDKTTNILLIKTLSL